MNRKIIYLAVLGCLAGGGYLYHHSQYLEVHKIYEKKNAEILEIMHNETQYMQDHILISQAQGQATVAAINAGMELPNYSNENNQYVQNCKDMDNRIKVLQDWLDEHSDAR